MKKFFALLMATLLIGTIETKAQNRCQIGDGTTYLSTIQASDNQIVKKVGNNIVVTTKGKNNPILTEGRATYTLTIAPEGNWEKIIVNNDEGYEFFQNGWDGPFEQEVSEGRYDIVVYGHTDDYMYPILLVYDQFEVSENTVFNPSMSEATNYIQLDGFDENGTAFSELPITSFIINVETYFVMSHGTWSLENMSYIDDLSIQNNTGLFFNNFGDRSTIYNTIDFTVEDQKAYFIQFPTLNNGIDGVINSSNDPEELVSHEEYFNINNPDSAYFSLNCYNYGPYPESYGLSYGMSVDQTYNPSKPLTVVTNVKTSSEPLTVGGTAMKFAVSSMIYESFDRFHPADLHRNFIDAFAPFPYALNDDGQMVREPYGTFLKTGLSEGGYPEHFPFTPAMYSYNPESTLTFGYRTPILYQHAVSVNESNSPYGAPFFGGLTGYLGEGGLQRMKDEDRILRITYNGEEFFNDSVYLQNIMMMNFMDAATVEYDITNDNLVVDGVEKANITHIAYDMRKADGVPPTLTLLQVMNSENEEVIEVNYDGKMNFACGDFHADLEMNWNMIYEEAVKIELYYKTADSEYQPLEFAENEAMFHVNYGNFYEVPMSQFMGKFNGGWVTIKIVLTDEEGNLQEQELQNLFYIVDNTSVAETNTLTHTVYPNPFTNEVRINANETVNGNASISVFNVLGEQVYNYNMKCNDTKEFVIDGSSLNAGIYFYNISTENGELKGRIVKE